MDYLQFAAPPYPFFVVAGNATYRPGDRHRRRAGIGYFDLILVERGALFMELRGTAYEIGRGGVILIPPDCPHGGAQVCREATHFHWIHFDSAQGWALKDGPQVARRAVSSTVTVNHHDLCFDFAVPLFQALDAARLKEALSLLTRLESISINKYAQALSTMENSDGAFEQQAVFLRLFSTLIASSRGVSFNNIAFCAMQHITLHYGEKITLADLARAANCHPTHVIRCMKQYYGLTPSQALLNARLQQARLLLRTTDMSVTAISENVGFSACNYFCKIFKQNFAVTPQGYRQSDMPL